MRADSREYPPSPQKADSGEYPQSPPSLLLYHGSDVATEHPDVTLNTGFSDLGQGFYLTDDHDAAYRRAATRARRTAAAAGVVSVFELTTEGLPWVTWGQNIDGLATPYGLTFSDDLAGITAWLEYLAACRRGKSALGNLGEPAIVRAWIATEEAEMVSSGLIEAQEAADYIDPSELIVQYCVRDQAVADARLRFVRSEIVEG